MKKLKNIIALKQIKIIHTIICLLFVIDSTLVESSITDPVLTTFSSEKSDIKSKTNENGAKFVVYSSDDQIASVTQVGGKAASLIHLQQAPNISVPRWICLTTTMFHQFLEHNNLTKHIQELDRLSQKFSEIIEEVYKKEIENHIYALAQEIRNLIINGELSDEFRNEIHIGYLNIIKTCGPQTAVAVRSSGIMEDLPDSSFAGIYDTFLNQKDEKSVISSIKKCWASVFNDRAVFERNSKNIKHEDALAGVIIQQMIHAKAAGTAFNMEIATGYNGIEIAANNGLGESVVGGEVSVDKWLVNTTTKHIIKSTLGNKEFKFISDLTNSGLKTVVSTEEEKNHYVLDQAMVEEIACKVEGIGKYYLENFSYPHIDTEFAIDQEGKLHFLQARSLVSVELEELRVLDSEDAAKHKLLAKGRFSVPGVTWGKVKVIPSWQDLADGKLVIEPDDIVVTYVSTNTWTQYMTKFKGMITQEGGPTSHPMLLCRERKVPCVIGIPPSIFQMLLNYDGQYITIDGINQKIYEGKVQFKMATPEDFFVQFEVKKEYPLLSREDHIKELASYDLLIIENKNGKEVIWQKKPNYPLDKILQEINILSYAKRNSILRIDDLPLEVSVINDYVAECFHTEQENLERFQKMDLVSCEQFIQRQEEINHKYLELCSNFKLTLKDWKEYINLASEFRADLLIGYYFRDYVNRQAIREAEALQIPQFYYDAFSEQLQSTMQEEDSLMVQNILELAKKIENFKRQSYQTVIELSTLEKHAPDIYLQLEKIAKQYRFQKNLSFSEDLDIKIAFKRIQTEIQNIGADKILDLDISSIIAKDLLSNEHYFPQDDVLRRWISLGIKSRILQSNCSHTWIRGQWPVREALLELGDTLVQQGILNDKIQIFNLSIEEVSGFLK